MHIGTHVYTHGYVYVYAGLDVNRHHILEIACIITDKELNVVAEVHST